MDPYELIMKKRDGGALTDEEIEFIVSEFTESEIPDYQMSAWLMAVWFKGMNSRERAIFTRAMVDTGETLSYPRVSGKLVDKHSTGGVGDGTSLALVPLVASFDVRIPMMSGRGLGHTGGTLDKLESIPGFNVEFNEAQINELLTSTGALIMGQTGEVAPADKQMYALRDVTATVDSVDLIAGSIMSKKIAEGMDSLVLDVKTGAGAFMKEYDQAVELARAMVEIGTELGKDMRALITDMNQPLGRAVGNALEMRQAIEILKDQGPADLTEITCRLAAEMLVMAGKYDSESEALEAVREQLTSGEALEKLAEIIEAQSGDPAVVDDYSLFPGYSEAESVNASESGYVTGLNAYEIGMAAKALGAGRETMESSLDYGAGIMLEKKIGEPVEAGETLARLCYNNDSSDSMPDAKPELARKRVTEAFALGDKKPGEQQLVYARMDDECELTDLDVPR